MKTYKILCTGNPSDRGIAMATKKIFPDAEFISRTSGFDLTFPNPGDEQKFREKLKGYNVFINNAHIQTGNQEKLLRIIREEWTEGHVFGIGSLEEYEKWAGNDMACTIEKRQLREASLALGDEVFKTTHIIVGGFQALTTGSSYTMDPVHIAKAIKWIMEAEFEVPIFGIEQMSDYIRNYYRTVRENGFHPPELCEKWKPE
jgi:hypothetical protein